MIESEIDRGIFVSPVEAERTAFHQLIDRYISEIATKHKGAYSESNAWKRSSVIRWQHASLPPSPLQILLVTVTSA